MLRKLTIRGLALGYLAVILLAPLAMIFYNTFKTGLEPIWQAISDPNTIHAFKVTLDAAAIAVPVNTVFGILCGLLIVRRRFPGKGILNAFIDLPLAISPVVVGLCLYLLYGQTGWFGGTMFGPYPHPHPVLFAMPAIVLATIFVSVPFVAREVIPTLREIGTEQEQAAATLGATGGNGSGGSRCRRSAGRSSTASCSRPRAASASTAPSRSSPAASRGRRRRPRSASTTS